MSMEAFYDPACGSSKMLAEEGIVGEGGIGKTALVLNYVAATVQCEPNIFLSFNSADLKEHKSALYEALQELHRSSFDFIPWADLNCWEDLRGWRRYTRSRPSFETPKTTSYGQSFLAYPKTEYPTCCVDLLDQCRVKDFGIIEPLPTSSSCPGESGAQSSFPGEILSIYLFLRQAYKLAAFLLARLAAFFQRPVTSVKKAVSERRFFVLNETHPPEAAALSSGLLAAF